MHCKTSAFLPATPQELERRGWERLDVILVCGDTCIDSPFSGTAVIGRVLEAAGYRVGIISQPDLTGDAIALLGEPRLFWGVSGGTVDSMVANYTASGRRRKQDDHTPGGCNNRRPDRAAIVYANLIRQRFKNTCPIVLGGIEASLRRIAHYDYWANAVRRSVLLDARADYILYGMAEQGVLELASCLHEGRDPGSIRGLCYAARARPESFIALPSYEEVSGTSHGHKQAFTTMFRLFYQHSDPHTGQGLAQQYGTRWLLCTPPPLPLSTEELDAVHRLPFQHQAHPHDLQGGTLRASDTISWSLTTHRGCYGECNFCAIAVHQGRTVTWRSRASIVAEAQQMTKRPGFKGRIQDVGGPTANMYGIECRKKQQQGSCTGKRCLSPSVCKGLSPDHREQIRLLEELRAIKGVRQVVVASGIRPDLVLADTRSGQAWLKQLVRHHVSGQLKLAPEHSQPHVLACMGKPGTESLLRFRALFQAATKEAGLPQYLTYYLLAAHPGCTQADMDALRRFCQYELRHIPQQIQIFTPTPSTWSTLMYWTGHDPFTNRPCFVERDARGRERQKDCIRPKTTPAL